MSKDPSEQDPYAIKDIYGTLVGGLASDTISVLSSLFDCCIMVI